MNRYRQLKVAIIAASLFTEGGDWRSLFVYARREELRGEKVALIRLGARRSARQFLAIAAFAPRVILNGLGTVGTWRGLLLASIRKDVGIYLHETAYMLDEFRHGAPWRYRWLKKIMRRNPVLCVSRQAEQLYQERFGAQRTCVVYECPGTEEASSNEFDPSATHIVMTGSLNPRKGVELFSRVADLAAVRHPTWKFHWLGAVATMEHLYQSPKVTWHGWTWYPGEFLQRCQLFFLASVDDPCPLSALEALGRGLPVVAYRGTGTAEIVEGLPGCAVFSEHTPEAAMEALEQALVSPSEPAERVAAFQQVASMNAFSQRIDDALSMS